MSSSRLPPLCSSKHEHNRCHLCGGDFLCKVTRGWMCPCSEIELTPEQSEKIQWKTGGTCVCNSCLLQLRSEVDD
ncbi:MAG: cysteine-rich CWC family protein [Akkermansiaceae bacterium]